jgi:hypothetical protein
MLLTSQESCESKRKLRKRIWHRRTIVNLLYTIHSHFFLSETSARKLLGVTTKLLTNVDRAPLTLNLLLLKHPFTTQEDLITRIMNHYKRQGLQQGNAHGHHF